ncbi:MAG: pantoate--beta-alanine ligase [Candidatus Competibacter sp.]|nr:pantoate--beta-alanine ligase [Candidatus Competibacter sp.]MDG4583891.1 pantoate--beta-alanine ligase [Candidatus Competibacter sp.]
MQTIYTIAELRARIAAWKRAGERVAFVPTMGNLHRGHLHLVERARALAARSVASIFVNPMQFGANEDYAGYPRTLEDDSRQLEAVGLDLLFAPRLAEIYPRPLADMTQVTASELSAVLCGVSRPVHFSGVTTVVAKLFNMVQPDVAVFGEKDWQQLVIIRRMVADLDFPVEIVGVPTVREPDGLAMSSRNGYLSAEERARAPMLYSILRATAGRLRTGERDCAALEVEAKTQLEAAGFRPDYFEIRCSDSLRQPIPADVDLRIFAAAWLGRARLIDNLAVVLD